MRLARYAAFIAALLWSSIALGQTPFCPTRPFGDQSNACANTLFVQTAINAGAPITLPNNNIFIGNGSNIATAVLLSGDCTTTNLGVITCTKSNNVAFGTAAFQNTGTSGANIPFLNGANTFSGNTTYSGTGTFSALVNFQSTFQINANTITWPSQATTVAALNIGDQVVTGGANVTSQSLTTGNVTIDCGSRPLQFITNNGAFTITAPANDGSCLVLVTNGASAGTITFSGFSVGSSTGDALTTTNTQKFTLSIWRVNSISGYRIAAHQ